MESHVQLALIVAVVSCVWITSVTQCERHRHDANVKIHMESGSADGSDHKPGEI